MSTDTATARELSAAVNRTCAEAGSNTPDFILGDFLAATLQAFDAATRAREQWYGVSSERAARLVFEALGTASVCWEKPGGAGVFQSEQAAKVGRELLEALGFEVPEGYRERPVVAAEVDG